MRNTLIPVITVAGLQLGALIAFSIITETVFQWPGLGLLIIQAITFGDMPVIAAYLLLIALLFVTINTAVDLLYFRVDPRVRIEMSDDDCRRSLPRPPRLRAGAASRAATSCTASAGRRPRWPPRSCWPSSR